jgi:MarR family transcriptional regulator, organic hydroperoxide resistance regulator
MRAMHVHRQAMNKLFASTGHPAAQTGCLRILDTHDGMSQREMADFMHLSRPTVTAILQAAEKAGAVVRRPDEHDQRITRVYLTDEGRRLSESARSVLADYINAAYGAMPAEERGELARLLDKVCENTEQLLGKQATTEEGAEARR